MLVFDRAHGSVRNIAWIGELRTLRGEERVLVVQVIYQKAGSQDIAAGYVGLQLGEITEAQSAITILADGQSGVDGVVILAIEGIVKPNSVLHDGTGQGEQGKKLIETPAVFILHGGEEVGSRVSEVIVADPGVEVQDSGGAFAILRGLARRFDLDGAECVGADAYEELSIRGLGDVEAVEQGHGLI